ncbi:MAG: 5'/3'-nucleotidase SurE [Planctomycetaceae bacterium]
MLYSGTVAAAIEGAFFGVTSVAISLNLDSPPDYERTARRSVRLIRDLLAPVPGRGAALEYQFSSERCRTEGGPVHFDGH